MLVSISEPEVLFLFSLFLRLRSGVIFNETFTNIFIDSLLEVFINCRNLGLIDEDGFIKELVFFLSFLFFFKIGGLLFIK